MDANKFTQKSLQAVQNAQNTAVEYGNPELTVLHIAHALMERDGLIFRILKRTGADADGFASALRDAVERLPRTSGGSQPYATPAVSRLFSEAEKLAEGMKDSFISVEHLFLCLFDNDERGLKELFARFGITKNFFLAGLKEVRGNQNVTSDNPEETYEALEKYGTDLTKRAREHKLEPVIGRDEEIRNVVRILSRKTKNNPVLIGEPGVGKTAIAEGLAQRIVKGLPLAFEREPSFVVFPYHVLKLCPGITGHCKNSGLHFLQFRIGPPPGDLFLIVEKKLHEFLPLPHRPRTERSARPVPAR